MSFEQVCPNCRRVCFSPEEYLNHKPCEDLSDKASAEIALANLGPARGSDSRAKQSSGPREVPAEVASDSSWRAAFLIFNSEPFVDRAWIWDHVDLVRCSIFFPKILEYPWSSSEQMLLEIAWSLFNSDLCINLYRAFSYLDDRQTLLALRAIAEYARIPVTAAGHFGFDREGR